MAPARLGSFLALAVLFAVEFAGAQAKFRVYDTGVNFDPLRIGQKGTIAGPGGSSKSYAWDRVNGLIQIPGFAYGHAYAEDVNASGQVVGWSYPESGPMEAFIWDRVYGMRLVSDFGGTATAYGINDPGEVVGNYARDSHQNMNAFLFRPGLGWVILPPLHPGGEAGGYRINNREDILGYSTTDPNSTTTVIWHPDGSMVDLGNMTPQYQNFPNDLNNKGYVCGGTYGPLGSPGYLWSPDGSYTPIYNTVNQGDYLSANGLNDFNLVVGTLGVLTDYGLRGFVRYQNGTIKVLNDLLDISSVGWNITEANDVNNLGQIAAVGYKNGQRRGVLLQPVLGPPIIGSTTPP